MNNFFYLANLFFSGLILLFIGIVLATMFLKIRRESKHQKWKLMADLLIRKAIFFEDEAGADQLEMIPVTARTTTLLKNKYFRKLLTQELVNAKKNVSGSSADNLTRLYLQLNLNAYALAKLRDASWHKKAQVIQELSIFGLKQYLTKIYRYTNDANDLLRMEAQVAIVRLSGFEGLRFLDLVSRPVSEWQQIKLLHELSNIPAENFNGIDKWLKSPNKTVVTFGLKLVRIYHRFELHDPVCTCLTDQEPQVRLHAISALGEIYNEQTSGILISRILKEDIQHRMAIIKVLQNIATNEDIQILLDQLETDHAGLKQLVARALSKVSPEGYAQLQRHDHALEYPLNEIIAQIKSEFAL